MIESRSNFPDVHTKVHKRRYDELRPLRDVFGWAIKSFGKSLLGRDKAIGDDAFLDYNT